MSGCNGHGDPVGALINSVALVSYLPSPLGEFLDRLRADLVRDCSAKAHVTVLPPRPLLCPPAETWKELAAQLHDIAPFRVELGDVEVFPGTQVVYLSIRRGSEDLKRIHKLLNNGKLWFEEPYQYHPHVTLAQEIRGDAVAQAERRARSEWHKFSHGHGFEINTLTFVQNTRANRWTDLNGFPLPAGVRI